MRIRLALLADLTGGVLAGKPQANAARFFGK
jgi:hypothetical protein